MCRANSKATRFNAGLWLLVLTALLMISGFTLVTATTCPPISNNPQLAFETAVGFGRYACSNSPEVPYYTVDSLEDYDPALYWPSLDTNKDPMPPVPSNLQGTLRYIVEHEIGCSQYEDEEERTDCLTNKSPQATGGIITFDVTGEINLMAPLTMRGSFITMDGSTAPYDDELFEEGGITITGNQFTVLDAHDVVIRYMRFRSGVNTHNTFHCARSFVIAGESAVANNIIVDHCSIGASQDDNFSIWGKVCHITIQWCIIGGGVYADSKAGIGSGGPFSFLADEGITICHNLITNTRTRQLAFGGEERIDFYNNVIAVEGSSHTTLSAPNQDYGPRINIMYNWNKSASQAEYETSPYYIDPVRAETTTQPCSPDCGNKIYVPGNEDLIHMGGNRFERHIANSDPPEWNEPYLNGSQWDMTTEWNSVATPNLPTDLQKDTAYINSSMWSNDDLVDEDEEMEAMYNAVINNAGCRVPGAMLAVDDCPLALIEAVCDQQLLDRVIDGTRIWPAFQGNHDLHPNQPNFPIPATGAEEIDVDTTTLKWTQAAETEYFIVYFKAGSIAEESLFYIATVPGVGLNHDAYVEIPSEYLDGGKLHPGQVYYWRVDAYNGCAGDPTIGPTPGSLWVFSTEQE